MDKTSVTFLGTSNAIPTEKRNHTSILLSYKNENILIDCGEGTQRQLKIAKISPSKITRILITHWHGDHILGLPGLIQTLAMSGYQNTLHIYGPQGTQHYMNAIMALMTASVAYKIKLEYHEVIGKFLDMKEFYIEAEKMFHGTPTNAYVLVIKDKIRLDKKKLKKLKLPNTPLLHQLANGKDIIFNNKKIKAKDLTYLEKGKKITFILDTGMHENIIKTAQNSDILIAESTFSKEEETQAREYKHLTATDAATIAKKAKAKRLILTHISQRYEHIPYVIEKQAKKIFKNTKIAKDFDVVEI